MRGNSIFKILPLYCLIGQDFGFSDAVTYWCNVDVTACVYCSMPFDANTKFRSGVLITVLNNCRVPSCKPSALCWPSATAGQRCDFD